MIRVFLVDDQSIVRQGLSALLELAPDLQVVGDAENGKVAIEQLRQWQNETNFPEVILMDIRMPQMDGVATTQLVRKEFPATKVLVLTTFDDSEYVSAALRCGALGYLLKDTPAKELAEAIRLVHKGYNQLGPGILQKVLDQIPANDSSRPQSDEKLKNLTPREQEVLQLIAQGASNQEIAQALYISEGTVKYHVTNILGQLGLRDRTQAAILANASAKPS